MTVDPASCNAIVAYNTYSYNGLQGLFIYCIMYIHYLPSHHTFLEYNVTQHSNTTMPNNKEAYSIYISLLSYTLNLYIFIKAK